jgi:hypothetical protein
MEDISTEKLACPSCGFLSFDGSEYGSYDICPVCDWEDDAVQLCNPASSGGANHTSLIESQENILPSFPPQIIDAYGLRRDPLWRPISESEKMKFKAEQAVEHWRNSGHTHPKYAYWNNGKGID